MEYLNSIIYVKLKIWPSFSLCKFSILFSRVKLKSGHIFFPNSSIDSKFGFSSFGLRRCLLLKWWIAAFEELRLQYQIFRNSLKCLKIRIFEVPLPSYFSQTVRIVFQYDMWLKRRKTNLLSNYQFSSKNVYIIM